MNFSSKPILVFWETTRACQLSCVHCRASAITEPLPGELTTAEGQELIDNICSFGKPYPTVIFTGGDPLKRCDLFELLAYASKSGVSFAVSPAVTPLLTSEALKRLRDAGASSISISLDGASPETHDSIRGQAGTYVKTLDAISHALECGLNVQVNTAIMKRNFQELPEIFHLIRGLGVRTWELFFLVRVGRATNVEDLSPEENESVCNFLYDASHFGLTIRCVEGPFMRRVAKLRREKGNYWNDPAYQRLRSALEDSAAHSSASTIGTRGTLDGDGIIFVAYDGSIYPGGLVPVNLGNVKQSSIVETYRRDNLLVSIRERKMNGPCGRCEFKEICGGSRARALSHSGDPMASDPACLFAAN